MKHNIEQINKLFGDLSDFHLVLFGVSLTIFTLLYSFILSKREELKSISELVKTGDKSPILAQKESFAKKYITRFKTANQQTIYIILITFILFLSSWLSETIISNNCIQTKTVIIYIISGLTILIIFYSIYIFVKILKHYKEEIKI